MKITGIKSYMLKGRHWPRFPWIIVEVETDEGVSGIGESLPYRTGGIAQAVEDFGRNLVGEDPFNIEKIWERAFRQGIPLPALSGVETALWDILGKKLGTPIYNLLGGRCREKVRVYVDGFFRGAKYVEEEYTRKAVEAVDQGFTALKMDVDEPIPSAKQLNRSISLADLKYTVNMVKAVRDAVGDGIDLAIDAHGAFDTVTSMKLAEKLEGFDLMWIEDPIPSGNALAMAKVSSAISTPICTGELLNTRYEFRELLENQAADIIMPDLARTGGVLEMKKIAAQADTYYIPIAPHNMVGPIATMASAHLCACVPNFFILEFQLGDVEWRDRLLDKPVPIKNGYIELPTTPGIGFEIDREELRKHLV